MACKTGKYPYTHALVGQARNEGASPRMARVIRNAGLSIEGEKMLGAGIRRKSALRVPGRGKHSFITFHVGPPGPHPERGP